MLHTVLHKGGILVVINANYHVEDTQVAHVYKAVSVHNCTHFVPLFDSAGAPLPMHDVCVFIKQGAEA